MWDDMLTLDQAAAAGGYSKRALRDLLRAGKLPGVRQEGRWYIARADFERLLHARATSAPTIKESATPKEPVAPAPASPPREEMLALIDLIRRRDEQIVVLQEERVRLAGQIGFLQAQLLDRETRLRMLEAGSIDQRSTAPPAQLATGTPTPSVDGAAPEPPTSITPIDAAGSTEAGTVPEEVPHPPTSSQGEAVEPQASPPVGETSATDRSPALTSQGADRSASSDSMPDNGELGLPGRAEDAASLAWHPGPELEPASSRSQAMTHAPESTPAPRRRGALFSVLRFLGLHA